MALKSKQALLAAVSPIIAQDAKLDVDALTAVIEAVWEGAADGEQPEMKGIPPITAADAKDDEGDEDDEPKGAEDESDGDEPGAAMDAAQMNRLIDQARRDALTEAAAIRTAEREVAPVVGEVVAMDSAAAVYKVGLEGLGVDLRDVPASAYGATFRAVAAARAAAPTVAMDARPSATARSDFNSRFPKRLPLVKG